MKYNLKPSRYLALVSFTFGIVFISAATVTTAGVLSIHYGWLSNTAFSNMLNLTMISCYAASWIVLTTADLILLWQTRMHIALRLSSALLLSVVLCFLSAWVFIGGMLGGPAILGLFLNIKIGPVT